MFFIQQEIAAEYLKMGLYLGIGGVVTFKNAKKLKETVQYAPLSQLVLKQTVPICLQSQTEVREIRH